MTFIPAPHVIKVVIEGTAYNQAINHVLYFVGDHNASDGELQDMADAVYDQWRNGFQAQLSEHYSTVRVVAIDASVQDGHQAVTLANENAGGISGSMMALNAAAVVTKHTDKRGRSYRGRLYLGGLPASKQVGGGSMDTTWLAAIITSLGNFLTGEAFQAFLWCIVSYYLDHEPRTEAHAEVIQAISTDTLIDSQRRRLVGRGS